MVVVFTRDTEQQERRREANRKYYLNNQHVRESKQIQIRLRKLRPVKRHQRLNEIWSAIAEKQALGEIFCILLL